MSMNESGPDLGGDEGSEGLQAPQALVAALRRLEPRTSVLPPEIEQRILNRCRSELAARQREADRRTPAIGEVPARKSVHLFSERGPSFFQSLQHWIRWAAVASVALIGIVILWRGRAVTDPGFIDLSRPTILDAFTLARKVHTGAPFDPRFDLNADGRMDDADASVLAQRAVTLPEGGAL